MTNKAVRYGIDGISVVLLVVMAFVGAASAAESVTINSVDEWNAFAAGSDNYTKDIVLGRDLDFTGMTIQPLNKTSFGGTINGNYHTISNFSISGSSDLGLIGSYTGSKISNLTVSNFSVSGSGYVGGVIGEVMYSCSIEDLNVIYGEITDGSSGSLGGIIAYASARVTFENCTVMNTCVACEFIRVGGIIGFSRGDTYINASCVNCCDISGGSYEVGGLVGYGYTGSVFVVDSLVNECNISGSNYVGGMIGHANNDCKNVGLLNSSVENCVIKSSGGYSGGCLGRNVYKGSDTCTVDNCTVKNCAIYASSSIGGDPCGGIIGGCVLGTQSPTVYPKVSNCTVEFCTIAGQGNNPAGGIAGTFPTAGTLDRNKVISSCIVSKSGLAAGICPKAC